MTLKTIKESKIKTSKDIKILKLQIIHGTLEIFLLFLNYYILKSIFTEN